MTEMTLLMSGGVAGRSWEPEGQEKGKCRVWGENGTPSSIFSFTGL